MLSVLMSKRKSPGFRMGLSTLACSLLFMSVELVGLVGVAVSGSFARLVFIFVLISPRNKRRTIRRLYQAFGKAKISVSRRISYLNEALPISTIVENRTMARCSLDFLKFVSKLIFLALVKWNLTNSTLILSESLRSLSANGENCDCSRCPDFLPPPYGWKMYTLKSARQPVILKIGNNKLVWR